MTRGCAIFAVDNPTMNEYILHRENGYLFSNKLVSGKLSFKVKRKIKNKLIRNKIDEIYTHYPLCEKRDWKDVESLDIEKLGKAAYNTTVQGYQRWKSKIDEIAAFILEE